MTETTPKKAQTLRTYPVKDKDGKQRWVETTGRAKAIEHIYDPEVGEPLTTQEVLAIVREHGADAIERAAQ